MFIKNALAYNISNPTKFNSVGSVLTSVIPNVYIVAGLIFFFLLIMGGINYMMAGGDDKAIGKAKNTLTAAVIGLVIVIGSGFAIRILETVLGIEIFG